MTPRHFTEAELVERPALELLGELGWEVVDAYSEKLGPAGTLGRDSIRDVSAHLPPAGRAAGTERLCA